MSEEQDQLPPSKSHPKVNDSDKHPFPASTGEGYYYYSSPARTALTVVLVLVLMIGAAVLVLYLMYRPEKPQFAVMAVAVYDLNVASSALPPLVSVSMQFTLLARNPNAKTRVFYDRLTAYVTYKNHPLTMPVGMPPLTLGKHEAVTMSPVMGGVVPVEAEEEVVNGLEMDEGYGMVGLRVVLAGMLRWKAGVFWSRHRRLSVRCDVLMGLKKGLVGRVPLLATPPCKVDA
ncbi:hypothetical protein MLD38_006991 [Melastoma candidum]|uniref:Uncharacterized protein n=1 Tax=Melastoma candidum TaxID=119954 RepID=A0ACB9RP69_9MYRT|nr:hypothetical protein MLD38_006991 [Melastoma candidum]